jgi:GNAT superfamily N-acetyltransferase
MTATLRDGAEVLVRPVEPGDKPRLLDAFERLGPRSRYQRFLAPTPELSAAALRYLTEVDHHDHEALVAVEPGGAGVGIARFVRVTGRPDVAEAAVTVVDDWQGRGVGTLLLQRLADRAREEGVERFWAVLLSDNRDMLDLLERLGRIHVVGRSAGTLEVEVELPPQGVDHSLRELLRAVARGVVEAALRR